MRLLLIIAISIIPFIASAAHRDFDKKSTPTLKSRFSKPYYERCKNCKITRQFVEEKIIELSKKNNEIQSCLSMIHSQDEDMNRRSERELYRILEGVNSEIDAGFLIKLANREVVIILAQLDCYEQVIKSLNKSQ